MSKIVQPIFWYYVRFDSTDLWYNGISPDRTWSSPTELIRNTENWNINVRYTKLVSKYSSDWVGLEKYHKIPFSTTGFVKTGLYPQFLPKVELKLWRHTQDLFLRSFLYFSWHYSLPSYKISNWYHLFKKSYSRFVNLKYRTCASIFSMWISRPI